LWLIQLRDRKKTHGRCMGAAQVYAYCMSLWTKIFLATGLAVVHQHLPCYYPSHHVLLITSHNPSWGIGKGQVTARQYCKNDKLRRAVHQACSTILP